MNRGSIMVTGMPALITAAVPDGAGSYAFGDYVKIDLPLLLLTMLVTIALVAVIYPL